MATGVAAVCHGVAAYGHYLKCHGLGLGLSIRITLPSSSSKSIPASSRSLNEPSATGKKYSLDVADRVAMNRGIPRIRPIFVRRLRLRWTVRRSRWHSMARVVILGQQERDLSFT